MGIPQIIMIVWCLVVWVWSVKGVAKVGELLEYSCGIVILGALVVTIIEILFQGLLIWGGFYG